MKIYRKISAFIPTGVVVSWASSTVVNITYERYRKDIHRNLELNERSKK